MFRDGTARRRGEPSIRLHVRICERLPARAAAGVRRGRGHLLRLRVLLVVLRLAGWRTRSATSTAMTERAGPGPRTASSSRWPATTATCCSTSSRRGHPGARHRARRERRRGGAQRRASGPRSRSSARDRHARSPTPVRPGRPGGRQQRLRARARHRRLRAGLRRWSRTTASVTLEFPHLLRLIERRQYDTIYHEHYSYLSLLTSAPAPWPRPGLARGRRGRARHARRLAAGPTPADGDERRAGERVARLLADEEAAGLHTVEGHEGVRAERAQDQERPGRLPADRRRGKGLTVAGYGAPGKGNTLLNHCGIRPDLLAYTVDRSTFKQGRFLPGTHIPIHAPERLAETSRIYILDPAVEPAGRDRRPAAATSGSGARSSSSRSPSSTSSER